MNEDNFVIQVFHGLSSLVGSRPKLGARIPGEPGREQEERRGPGPLLTIRVGDLQKGSILQSAL